MDASRSRQLLAVRLEMENEWAWCGDRRLALTPRAFAVLRHLVEHAGRLITKDELLATVWRDAIVSDAALASCIRDLRKALRDPSSAPRYIETVHRRGFRFIGPVARPAVPAASSATRTASAAASTAPAASRAIPGPARAMPAFVGRQGEIERLSQRLDNALAGQRQLVFVTGEPGIGKTALVEAFLSRIGGPETPRIGRGQCVEHYGAGEPYLPVLEALGRLGRQPGGDEVIQVLKQDAPTWLAELPALLSDADLEAVQRRALGATRDRMLREIVEALDALAGRAPLVLVLEDLHWSDSATIDLLAMLARRRDPAQLLVVATYRPADVPAATHPLLAMKRELQVHGYCEEIALDFLSAAAVGEYLARRFPSHEFPPELAHVLQRSTEGNALFLVNTVDDLIARGMLRELDGTWRLSGRAEVIATGAPETLWQMVERQVDRLTADEQAMLAVASVAGVEFSAAVAAADRIEAEEGERRCEALARRGQFVRPAGTARWPDGTAAGRYAFIHALYQQVFYERVSIGARVGLHLRMAECLERGHGDRAGEIAGELAMHFERGRDFERAARYRAQAGEHALRQHAHREAADHATRGLDLLAALPDGPERIRQELTLQVLLGAALSATRGYAAPEVARTYARARALCTQVGEAPQLFPVLLGLGRYYVVRAEFDAAREVARHLASLAEATRVPAQLLAAENALGVVAFYAGDFDRALGHLERGIELYDTDQHRPARSPAFRFGQDPGVSCTVHAAMALWILGYPARAAARAEAAVSLARSLGDPFSLSYACHFAAGVHQWRGDRRTVKELEDAALALDTEHGFGLFLTAGIIQRGWLSSGGAPDETAVARMRQGVAKHREIGAAVLVPAFLALVAEVHGTLGQPREALSSVDEALAAIEPSGQHYWKAELRRLRGALVLQADPSAAREAEACFLDALAIGERQHAKSLELRAATSLGRLWAAEGRVDEAHAVLSPVCDWFTEGFDTADVSEATSLLAELDARRRRGQGARS